MPKPKGHLEDRSWNGTDNSYPASLPFLTMVLFFFCRGWEGERLLR